MTGTLASVFAAAALAVIGTGCALILGWLAFDRPRLGLYAILALGPTQFVFVPVLNFFVSPADVLVLACATGLMVRLAADAPQAWIAIRLHLMLGFMIAAYLVGFVVLDHFNRTLVRVPLAIVPSILACELLTERRHFQWAVGSLIVAALLDAGYGMYFLAVGQRLHPTRFSGMMGLNFSAIVILCGAAMAFSLVAGARASMKLALPAVLAIFGLATLSKMGILVFLVALGLVLWKIATPAIRRLVVAAMVLIFLVAMVQGSVRSRLLARASAEHQLDGLQRTSTDVRVLLLRSAWHGFATQPFVGIGYGNFQPHSLREPEIQWSTAGVGYATHNTYLEVLVEGGLLAFIPFLLHFLSYIRGLKATWLAVAIRRDALVAAVLAGLLIVVISAAVANLLLQYVFWSVCGVALACFRRLAHGPSRTRPEVLLPSA